MRTWTEQTRVEHHWVLTQTERDTLVNVLKDLLDEDEIASTTRTSLEAIVGAAEAVVSGPS